MSCLSRFVDFKPPKAQMHTPTLERNKKFECVSPGDPRTNKFLVLSAPGAYTEESGSSKRFVSARDHPNRMSMTHFCETSAKDKIRTSCLFPEISSSSPSSSFEYKTNMFLRTHVFKNLAKIFENHYFL